MRNLGATLAVIAALGLWGGRACATVKSLEEPSTIEKVGKVVLVPSRFALARMNLSTAPDAQHEGALAAVGLGIGTCTLIYGAGQGSPDICVVAGGSSVLIGAIRLAHARTRGRATDPRATDAWQPGMDICFVSSWSAISVKMNL